jgi:hypothetical protein
MNKQEIEKALEQLEEVKTKAEQFGSMFQKDNKRWVNTLTTAISALQQQSNNGWIPVSERLPIEGERRHVYVTARHIEGTGCFTAKMIWEYEAFIWPNGKKVADKWQVLAWMAEGYLQPYKETDKEL